MKKAKCPICADDLEIEQGLEVGEIIYCSGCDSDLTIISLNPTKVKEVDNSTSSEKYADEEDGDVDYS
jgi:lysine biosynthesis protein LysW